MFEGKDVKVLLAQAGSGKGNWNECKIPTPNGIRRFGDLKVNDFVYDRLGFTTRVLGVYPRGLMEAYKVTLSDGRSTVVSLDHLWNVYFTPYAQEQHTLSLKEMLDYGIRIKDKRPDRKLGRPRFYVPVHYGRIYGVHNVKVNPYVFGVFTGNGSLTEERLTLSSNDEETVRKVEKLLGNNVKAKKRSENNYSWDFYCKNKRLKTADYFEQLYSYEKYIPNEYKYNSYLVRYELLQGLFDTDGSVTYDGTRCHVSYSTVSKRLALDIQEVLNSLGMISTVREDKREGRRICYNILVNTTNENKKMLFSLKRKKDIVPQAKEAKRAYDRVAVRSVEKLPELKEITCIYVANEEHLYQCDDGIVTHNTHRLIDEVAKELETRRPEEIAFVTFTRKGAEEGLRRVCNKFMLEPDDLPYFRTLHSLTFHALNLKSDQMFGRHDQKIFNSRYGYNVNRCEVNLSKATPTADSQLLDFYDLERSGALTSRQLAEMDIQIAYYKKLTRDYENYKRENKLVDFFDCLLKYVEQGESLPVRIALIDECQDITALQWKVIDKAFSRAEKIIVAGDENQCQPAGSKVLTALGWLPIEECQGKRLLTYDIEKDNYCFSEPVKLQASLCNDYLYTVVIRDRNFKSPLTYFTGNHKLVVKIKDKIEIRKAAYCTKETELYVPLYVGDKKAKWVKAKVVFIKSYSDTVYSLDVPKYHTYVTEGGLTVHNSIYTYSGARPDFLIELANKYPVENLAFSYRIPQSVYRLAKAITDFIGDKTKKPFVPRVENKEGSITQLSDIERLTNFIDVDSLCDNKQNTEWYILSRNNCYLKEATDILEEKLIPYWTTDGFFMGGDIMKRIKDYENFRLEGFRDETKRKAFAKKYGITDFTVDFTETNLFTEGRKWIYAAYIEKYGLKKLEEMCKWNPQILVSTVHQVKGGEASNVAFMLDATRRTYGNIFNNIDEELRILYVAVTRTKDNLFLIDSKNGVGYDEILQTIKDENNLKW